MTLRLTRIEADKQPICFIYLCIYFCVSLTHFFRELKNFHEIGIRQRTGNLSMLYVICYNKPWYNDDAKPSINLKNIRLYSWKLLT